MVQINASQNHLNSDLGTGEFLFPVMRGASCLDGVIDIDQQRGPSTFTSSVSRDFLLGLQKTQPFHEMIDKTSPGSHRLFF